MSRDEVDQIVCTIMVHDGPDRHVDGHDIITDFILSLQKGDEYEWKAKYFSEKGIDY